MLGLNKTTDITERLKQEFGEDAFAVVGVRVEEARQASDAEGVGFWNEVARRLMTVDRGGGAEVPDVDGRRLWWLMQRVECYRHHASEAERKAAAAKSGQLREDMTDLARGWRELALQADLLSQSF